MSGMYGLFEHNLLHSSDVGLCEQRVRFYNVKGEFIEITISPDDVNHILLRGVGIKIGKLVIHPEASNMIRIGINDE